MVPPPEACLVSEVHKEMCWAPAIMKLDMGYTCPMGRSTAGPLQTSSEKEQNEYVHIGTQKTWLSSPLKR